MVNMSSHTMPPREYVPVGFSIFHQAFSREFLSRARTNNFVLLSIAFNVCYYGGHCDLVIITIITPAEIQTSIAILSVCQLFGAAFCFNSHRFDLNGFTYENSLTPGLARNEP